MRKIIAATLSMVMIIASIPVVCVPQVVNAAETLEITSPKENQLMAAGHFDITWSDSSENAKEYDVYINDKLVATTTDTEYEYYTTEVKMHSVSIVAEDSDGSERESKEITFGVTKKGLAVNNEMGKYLEPVDMKVGWYYSWGTGPNGYRAYKDIEFVPMIWGPSFDSYIPSVAAQGYKYLLTYNEPDMGNDAGGCNTDVQTVIANWPKFLGYDFYLSAPASFSNIDWNGEFLPAFMNGVDQDTVDFIPVHCYLGTYGGVDAANYFLERIVDLTYETYGKPIWITEFAISGWGYSNANNRESVEEFLVAVMKGLDERSYVERYSWFSFDTTDGYNGASALWTNSTGELTELGKAYVENGNPEGYEPTYASESYTITESVQNTLLEDSTIEDGVVYEDYVNATGVTATASSQIANNIAANAIDESVSTRWESEQGIDPQNIIIDLGQVRNIKQIEIIWETASAKDYTIEVSEDGINYTVAATIDYGSSTQNRLDTITFVEMVKGRYVKINGTARSTTYGYSIFDMAVYGIAEEIPAVEVIEFQYNTTNNGFRVISAVEPEINGLSVVESGNIYGIDIDNLKASDITLDNLGTYVKKFEATSNGISDVKYSKSDTAKSYVMTMVDNGMSAAALSQKYMVRSYAVLEDGSVVYSGVEEFSIADIADFLYQNKKMSTKDKHDYLYINILSVVYAEYRELEY